MPRPLFMETIFNVVYDHDPNLVMNCQLSSLYSLISLGAVYDSDSLADGPVYPIWKHWAKTMFYLHLPLRTASIESLEAFLLLSSLRDVTEESSLDRAWFFASWGVKFAQAVSSVLPVISRDSIPYRLAFVRTLSSSYTRY